LATHTYSSSAQTCVGHINLGDCRMRRSFTLGTRASVLVSEMLLTRSVRLRSGDADTADDRVRDCRYFGVGLNTKVSTGNVLPLSRLEVV